MRILDWVDLHSGLQPRVEPWVTPAVMAFRYEIRYISQVPPWVEPRVALASGFVGSPPWVQLRVEPYVITFGGLMALRAWQPWVQP